MICSDSFEELRSKEKAKKREILWLRKLNPNNIHEIIRFDHGFFTVVVAGMRTTSVPTEILKGI